MGEWFGDGEDMDFLPSSIAKIINNKENDYLFDESEPEIIKNICTYLHTVDTVIEDLSKKKIGKTRLHSTEKINELAKYRDYLIANLKTYMKFRDYVKNIVEYLYSIDGKNFLEDNKLENYLQENKPALKLVEYYVNNLRKHL